MKEWTLYLIAALGFMFLLGYSIHMIVSGLVSADTERTIILIAEFVALAVLFFMGRSIYRSRIK